MPLSCVKNGVMWMPLHPSAGGRHEVYKCKTVPIRNSAPSDASLGGGGGRDYYHGTKGMVDLPMFMAQLA